MKMKRIVALFVAAYVVAACVPTPLQLGPAAGAQPIYCDTNCSVMWERAQVWFTNHSRWKIQNATDVMIETYNPTGYSATYGLRAVKEPSASGAHFITLTLACGNLF